MKRIFRGSNMFAIAVALMASAAFSSCDNDDDVNVSKVPEAVRDNFRSMFENVRNAYWEMESQYYVAEFTYNGFFTEAWYASDGKWAMTETDYGMQTMYLPLSVQNSFNESQYASYTVDEVCLYEKPISSFCVIELDSPNGNEISLFYDSYGNLLNTVSGDDYDITPNTDPSAITF